jgi:YidC/Oxa1 family membrane protein insertase
MDRNTITGLVLIFAILIGYSLWMTPSEEERLANQHRLDSIANVNRINDSLRNIALLEKNKQDSIRNSVTAQDIEETPTSSNNNTNTANQPVVNRDRFGAFANSSVVKNDNLYEIENDLMKIKISPYGGKIVSVLLKEFQTFDTLPLELFDEKATNFGLTFFANNRKIQTNNLYFQASDVQGLKVSGSQEKSFSVKLYTDASDSSYNENSYIEYRYTLTGNDYMLDFDISFVGMEDYLDPGTSYLDLDWSTQLLKLEKHIDRFNGPTIYYKFDGDDVDYLSQSKDDEENLSTHLKWISFKHRFFSSLLVSKDYFLSANIKSFNAFKDVENNAEIAENAPGGSYLRSMQANIGLPFTMSKETNIPMAFYFGPNKFNLLKKYDLDLEKEVPLGWGFLSWINRWAVLPVFNFLEGFGWNYGIIILVLTILLKLVLFPIAYKSYKSSAKMRVLKPEIDELGKKFPKKEDAMKKQQATMSLYKSAGVNPMAGCVPMLLQFPILIAMFRFFPAAFELRQQSFLWATDLSSYDSIYSWSAHIPLLSSFYGNHISLFTLLMTVSTLIYTKMNQDMMGSSQQQMPGMKTMMYLMPLMFLGMFNNYASGLSYYYFLANVITFTQMFLIRKTIDEDKIRAQIELNKKKPKKKASGWQKRLEEAAKQKGYKPKKK